MAEKKQTLGQAIDQIIDALGDLEPDARRTAIDAACSHLGVQSPGQRMAAAAAVPSTSTQPHHVSHPASGGKVLKRVDIRTLKEQKQPRSARQMACIVAFYLQEVAADLEKKDTISTQDLAKYFKQAGYRLPRALEQVLRDAKTSGYFDLAGRGEYKLNAVGYNLVAHGLPKTKDE